MDLLRDFGSPSNGLPGAGPVADPVSIPYPKSDQSSYHEIITGNPTIDYAHHPVE
jgi:hypothetical protein